MLLGAGSVSSDGGDGRAGNVMIGAGNSVSSEGGSMSLSAGSGQEEGGSLAFHGGASSAGASGAVEVSSSDADAGSGRVAVRTGSSSTTSGNVELSTGAAAGLVHQVAGIGQGIAILRLGRQVDVGGGAGNPAGSNDPYIGFDELDHVVNDITGLDVPAGRTDVDSDGVIAFR